MVLGLDCVRYERDEPVLVLFVEPRPLSVWVQFKKPKLAVFPYEVEAPEPVAGLVHESFDGVFFVGRQRTPRPRGWILYDGFSGVIPVE